MKQCCPLTGLADCGYCVANLRRRSSHCGHAGYRTGSIKKGKYVDMSIRRRELTGADIVNAPRSQEAGSFGAFPTLLERLSLESYDDGSARERDTLLLLIEGGLCKACINDRDGGFYAFVSGGTFDDVLIALEEQLVADTVEWRASKGRKGGKR